MFDGLESKHLALFQYLPRVLINKDEPVKFDLWMTRCRWKHLADMLEDTEGFDWLQQRILEEIGDPTLDTVRSDPYSDRKA